MKKLEEDVLLLEDQNSKFVKVKERPKAIIEWRRHYTEPRTSFRFYFRLFKIHDLPNQTKINKEFYINLSAFLILRRKN